MALEKQITISRTLRDGTTQEMNVIASEYSCTKCILNRLIRWSSSKYAVLRKTAVIDIILKGIQDGYVSEKRWSQSKEVWEEIKVYSECFHSGSYTEKGSTAIHGTYYVDYYKKYILDIQEDDNGKILKIYSSYLFH